MNSNWTDPSDGKTQSYWTEGVDMPLCPPLREDAFVDVVVVGAGIAGLTAAYLLQQEGKKVCVLENLSIGSGQTGRTTAHFTAALDDRYFEIERLHGTEGARLAAESHTAALAKVAEIVEKEKIDCDIRWVHGYLFRAPDSPEDILERELRACRKAGLVDVRLTRDVPRNGVFTGEALQFPRQLQLQPMKYLKALAEIILSRGGKIHTRTQVTETRGGEGAYVKTSLGYAVKASSILVATNSPINDVFAIHTKQSPYRSYVLGFRISPGQMEAGLYWDTSDPYHYVRLHGSDIVIVGGEDHKTGQEEHPEHCFERLESWARKQIPVLGEIVSKWSGQVMEPVDGLGFLGHNPMDKGNVYIITGDSGNGMTHATIGAMLVRDQIMGRKNRWEELYNPSRVTAKAVGEFAKENLNVALQYADWIKPQGAEDEVEKLAEGEGIVLRDGMKLVAVSRNEHGGIDRVSAICTHLGGVVRWNSVEKTWDCPCHGSRFDGRGHVVEGPALTNLKTVDPKFPYLQGEEIPTREMPLAPEASP